MPSSRSIIIVGAGLGGLAAGIYGRLNGYTTRIFEAHTIPGGQCTGWKRKGYVFDACIHHLFGCSPGTKINDLWRELGAMPAETHSDQGMCRRRLRRRADVPRLL